MQTVPSGGESSGKLELLKTPYQAALLHSDIQFKEHQHKSTYELIPEFYGNYWYGYSKVSDGYFLRNQMPVINEDDIEKLKPLLTFENIKDFCEICKAEAGRLVPLQSQLYFDKSIDSTAKFGLDSTIKFLQSNHLFVSDEFKILDGHHRWLTAMLLNPTLELNLFKITMPLDKLLPFMLKFSDDSGRLRNA